MTDEQASALIAKTDLLALAAVRQAEALERIAASIERQTANAEKFQSLTLETVGRIMGRFLGGGGRG